MATIKAIMIFTSSADLAISGAIFLGPVLLRGEFKVEDAGDNCDDLGVSLLQHSDLYKNIRIFFFQKIFLEHFLVRELNFRMMSHSWNYFDSTGRSFCFVST